MAVFKYDKSTKQMVKISDKSYGKASYHDRPLRDQVMDGYRRVEAMGQRINGNAAKIKKIWNN